ncbi:hypothetical protein SUGI_0323340 [Cryptomeria japonica]|uniref:uncharacterized protein LOC131059722 isoform X2 n=1 Tax=Cryptomeria japonica TaxID=3369 RepID=UPI002408D3BA|nr:uncharacterized protein LOC131059722 isoform X2 [Cryptomeria japonica]GLJ18284.1 hypothetical protein SUGI_0323340 [Cryptomeria japonica]
MPILTSIAVLPHCKPSNVMPICINAPNSSNSKQSTFHSGFSHCKRPHHLATRAAISPPPSPFLNQNNSTIVFHENGLETVDNGSAIESNEKEEEKSSVQVSGPPFKEEIRRRRNFAIISHPDAGKTTLTEKLLLYGGAIHEAGAVKARRAARHATSDWMELEKQRGISITSTAMVFETKGNKITLLDTPGHQDFGEDTFRTLVAADNAVMLVDAGKGLEPQTKKLFEVCRMRRLPVFTFINKMDRPALEPLELLDQIEQEFGLATSPVSWPIGSGDRFTGLYHVTSKNVHLFQRDSKHGSKAISVKVVPFNDSSLTSIIPSDLYKQLMEDIELIEGLFPPLDVAKIHSGDLSPVYFGSAMNNFGVELFLDSFLQYSTHPGGHESDVGQILPDYPHFSGFVFKMQANMDPKHRDKVAFVRVCSGQFSKGMKVQLARTGKTVALTRPQKLFGQSRETVDVGYAGDVIGLNNPDTFCIGDTVYTGPRVSFPGIPSFSPDLFCYIRNTNPSKYKQFQKGLKELLGEGAVQVLYSVDSNKIDPILAAIGQLQFEVLEYRMIHEYGVEVRLEPLDFSVARWVAGGWPAVEKVGKLYNCAVVKDMFDRPVLLFRNEWNVTQLMSENKELGALTPHALPLR